MSEVKVNKITPRTDCGTTQLGDSGDTVTVTGDLRSNSLKASDGGVIISQSGTTITVGASGDTVSLASGASQSGFGRTGTVDWQTGSIKTGDFTAVNGQGFFVDTNSGAVVATLPAGSAGAIVSFQDYRNTFDTNSLTVTPNGSEKINGGVGSVILSTEGEGLTLVYIDSTIGWRSIQDNDFATVGTTFITATGGTITTVCTDFKVHTFTGPGTFCVSSISSVAANNTVGYMVVAGGGGGNGDTSLRSGGGGAGGYREGKNAPVDNFTASPLVASAPTNAVTVTAAAFPITVGGGGANGGAVGSNSVFSTITSAGGGGGGQGQSPFPGSDIMGDNGGSGGGGGGTSPGSNAATGGTGNTPSTSPAQGTNGGYGAHNPGSWAGGGGGGGAGAAGGNASPFTTPAPGSTAGAGGNGVASSITGSSVTRAGGGGGGGIGCSSPTANGISGGSGGGGKGTAGPGSPPAAEFGTANTGGGGGASYPPDGGGKSGGSGIVVIRYKFQ